MSAVGWRAWRRYDSPDDIAMYQGRGVGAPKMQKIQRLKIDDAENIHPKKIALVGAQSEG
jgi:hypothetical protein